MKAKIVIAVALALVMMVSVMPMAMGASNGPPPNYIPSDHADMIAGGGNVKGAMDVGDIMISDDGVHIRVQYSSIVPITEIHLEIALNPEAIPQKNGNPSPGKFTINEMFYPGIMGKTYEIDILQAWEGQRLFIAAHAVVGGQCGLLYLEDALPETATISVSYPIAGGPSYFPQTMITDGGMLNGNFNGWCIDTDHTINKGQSYDVNVFSSYEALAMELVEHPENMDLVNWILNQNFVGKASEGLGLFTYSDVQYAIWSLIDDEVTLSGLYDLNQARAAQIIALALDDGDGFVPMGGQMVAVVLQPIDCSQVIIVGIPVPCMTCGYETAWGVVGGIDGLDDGANEFPGKNWAEFIPYDGLTF